MRKAFLAPWHPGVGQAWLYSLALAQERTAVAVHHAAGVVSHHHLSVTPDTDNLPRFLGLLHHEFSCATNTLLARERYDQPGELFDGRATHLMRLCDAEAQSTHLLYEYLNTVAAGLVSRPEHMPGFTFDFDLWLKGHIEVRRPDFYFSTAQPEVLRLDVTPPPLLYLAFDGDIEKLVYEMKRLSEQAIRELRAKQQHAPLGARAITRLHPWSEPRTLRETRGKRVPTFRIGARGIVGQQAHREAALEVRHFRGSHAETRVARAAGDMEREFPFGTYEMRVQHGAPVAAPEFGTGIITRPGPTLRDVQVMLEERAARGEVRHSPELRFELMDRTREALFEEAEALCEHASDGMDFAAPDRTGAAPRATRDAHAHDTKKDDEQTEGDAADDDGGSGTRPVVDDGGSGTRAVVVRHRLDKRRHDGGDRTARRVVTLRDRRKGRPGGTRHGSDPPA